MILLLLDSGINMVDDYDWKYCSGMHVGYTYELHWPHSNMGDCPTAANPWPKWQYQSHFMDGASHSASLPGTYLWLFTSRYPRSAYSPVLPTTPPPPHTYTRHPSTLNRPHVYGSPHHSPP